MTLIKKTTLTTTYTVESTTSGGSYGNLIESTFQNCQVFTIGNFAGILTCSNAYDLLNELFQCTSKYLCLVDIKEQYEGYLEKLFNSDGIVFKQKYKSTNGNNMTMYLINKNSLKNMKYKNLYEQVVAKKFKTLGEVYTFINNAKELIVIENRSGHSYPSKFKASISPSNLTSTSSYSMGPTTSWVIYSGGGSCYLTDIEAINEKVSIEDLKQELVDLKNKYEQEKSDLTLRIKTMKELDITEMSSKTVDAVRLLEKLNNTEDRREAIGLLSDALS